MYLTGYGAPRDLPTAASFFSAAARGGNVQAQLHLASMLHRGLGTPRDAELAASWYRQAADSGNSRAAVQFAIMRLKGEGGSRDYAEALPWLERAAQDRDAEAEFLTAMLLSHRHPFSPARSIPASASSHPAFAGVRFEPARALSLLQSAADSNHVPAMTALAEHHCSSQPPAYELAVPLYAAASEQANLTAQSRLGFLLHHGVGCEADRQRAVTLLSTAAEGGRVEAQLLLMVIASSRAQRDGGTLGRMRLKVDEVLKEYAAKAAETMERQREEWTEDERQRMQSVRDEPQRAVQWVREHETQRGQPWMGDLHELLATLPAEEKNTLT